MTSGRHAISRLQRLLDSGRGTSAQIRSLVSELPRRPDLRPQALTKASDWIDGQRQRWEDLFDVVAEYLEADKEGR